MQCQFYFDVMSPYTYFAFQVLKRYRPLWNLKVEFVPFFLGAVMKASGNVPPASVPNRALFLNHDVQRNAKWYSLPQFKGIPDNLFSEVYKASVAINRLLAIVCADANVSEDSKWRLVDAAFHIIWEANEYRAGTGFTSKSVPDTLADIARFSGETTIVDSVVSLIESAGKSQLRTNTDIVVNLDGFGSPILVFPTAADKSIFFGSDRFEQIAFLIGKPWFGPNPSPSKL